MGSQHGAPVEMKTGGKRPRRESIQRVCYPGNSYFFYRVLIMQVLLKIDGKKIITHSIGNETLRDFPGKKKPGRMCSSPVHCRNESSLFGHGRREPFGKRGQMGPKGVVERKCPDQGGHDQDDGSHRAE